MTVRGSKKWFMLAAFALSLAWGCSDEVVDSGGDGCSEGLRLNPITGECELAPGTGTPGPGTPGSNSGTPGANNETPGTNNPTVEPPATNQDPGPIDPPPQTNNGSGEEPVDPPPIDVGPCGPGRIIGRACAPSGDVLAAAQVIVEGLDCDGNPFTRTTQSSADGSFELNDVPAGQQELTIRTGSFESSRLILVRNGQTTDLTGEADKICLEGSSTRIAVIKGAYDFVQGILDDLGLEYEIKGGDGTGGLLPNQREINSAIAFLQSATAMSEYDIVFINCGELWRQIPPTSLPTILSSLRTFVNNGKSLYVSDRSHPFVREAFPEMLTFHGNNANHSEAWIGYAPQTITAAVGTQGMQTLLGRATAQVQFPHNPPNVVNTNWTVARTAGTNTTVHLSGDARLCTNSGNSCGSAAGTVSDVPLLVTHEAGGRVIYTSFHNKAQADFNTDMIQIMRFLIFQL
jgi:hypothetical protein